MKFNKNHLLGLIDVSASRAKNFVEGFNAVVDSLDMDTCFEFMNEKKAELIRRGNDLFGEFNELLKQVKESLVDFTVTVPYDKASGETIEYRVVDGNKLEITVTFESEDTSHNNCTKVRIPQNCDLENISLTVNESKNTATITIPKMARMNTNTTAETEMRAEDLCDEGQGGDEMTANEGLSESEPMTEEPSEEAPMPSVDDPLEQEPIHEPTMDGPSNSKLEEKLNANVEKCNAMLNRDARGRFVRRKPNT